VSEPFIAEIRIFAGNFAPRNWAFCNGQLLPIAQNTALFSLVGTIYGGDGRTSFGLPDLQGRAPMHPGAGPGLSPRTLGQKIGVTEVTLTEAQMPNHNHALQAVPDPAEDPGPGGNSLARTVGALGYQTDTTNNIVSMDADALSSTGGGGAHTNRQPYLGLNFIIALQGLYPSRN